MSLIEKLNLTHRVALVTGAAGGIGKAITAELLGLGATVVLADRSETEVAVVAESFRSTAPGRVDWLAYDVTDSVAASAAIEQIMARHQRLDVLVANAGIGYEEPSLTHSDENWRRVMSINLDGVFFTVRSAAQKMAQAGGGAIVAISSIAGVTTVRPELHIGYDVSKAGVVHMCRNLAVEWAKLGIRVNAVGPGYTDTAMLKGVGESNPAVLRQWLDDVPAGRLMMPEEIARGVAFLCTDAASGITGHNLLIDGGYVAS